MIQVDKSGFFVDYFRMPVIQALSESKKGFL
jgi:hypothetical protein